MVMRKHLNAGRITQIQQHENDRIIEILLETVNEMGFSVNKKLSIEIMGKHSNVILTDMTSGKNHRQHQTYFHRCQPGPPDPAGKAL